MAKTAGAGRLGVAGAHPVEVQARLSRHEVRVATGETDLLTLLRELDDPERLE
ncbi:hypothetical protein ACIQGO_15790 [Streptomyces shenzhenensis]|uniref:hypothetical protein n=1 Tax=Streptomyces shenzhenensis TaxID=943815 RepID=UPI00380CFDB0